MDDPKRKQNRLPDYDYSSAGAYFVTFCTQDRRCFLPRVDVGAIRESPLQRRQSTLAKAIGSLKMISSRQIRLLKPDLKVWQRSYYEHVIRSEQDYLEIWEYIDGNPAKWADDKYYIDP